MMLNHKWETTERIGWTIFIAFLFISIYGYTINRGDQEEHLPYVYKLINSNLYNNDYIVPIQLKIFNVRFFYAWILFGISYFIPISNAVFLVYFICLSTFIYFVGRITEIGSNWKFGFLLGPVIGLILLNSFTIGANTIYDNQLTCSCFATSLGAISFYLLQKNKISLAAVFCGIAALFQVLIGLHLLLVILLVQFLAIEKDKLKSLFLIFIIFLIFSSAMLIPILLRQSVSISENDAKFYYQILFNFRNAHHYIPSLFPLSDYLKTISIWILMLFAAFAINDKWNRIFIYLTVFVTSGCIMYWIGFEKFNLFFVGKLQWFKLTGWITLLGIIPFTRYLSSIPKFNFFCDKFFTNLRLIIWPISVLMILVIFNSSFIPITKFQNRYQIGNYTKTDLSKFHDWISKNTPIDCVILPIPNDDSFLCEAQRSIPVGFKAIIHEPFFMLPWYRHFNSVYGVGYLLSKKDQNVLKRAMDIYPSRPDSQVISPVKIDFRVWDTSLTSNLMIKDKFIVHQEGNFILTSFVK